MQAAREDVGQYVEEKEPSGTDAILAFQMFQLLLR